MSLFNQSTITSCKEMLNFLAVRQKVVSSNVANISTPGYKTKDVSFESVLNTMHDDRGIRLVRTHERHFDIFGDAGQSYDMVEPFYAYEPISKYDGINDVDIDKEMLKSSEIQTNFSIFSEMIRRKYQSIKSVVNGTP